MPTPERLLAFLRQHPTEAFRPSEVMAALRIPMEEKHVVRAMLRELERGGQLVRFRRGAYAAPAGKNLVEGVLQSTFRGDGWVVAKGAARADVFIPRRAMGQALDGDWVEAEILREFRGKPEGRVLRVVEHAHRMLVGQFLHTHEGGLVLPKNPKVGRRVRILRRYSRDEIPEGAWVVVRITAWSESSVEPLLGQVDEILGAEDEPGIDILVLLRDEGVQTEFPKEALEEAAAIAPATEDEIRRRRNLRGQATFTIDPETAKDFDDALSVEPLEGGVVRLGVHIADVAHYVRPGTALDAEAYRRATSIYPVDRVVPMLPPRLSDDLCSLRPNEDRLTMSVFMDLSPDCRVLHSEICESVIHSRFRLSYEEVQAVFDEKPFARAQELTAIHGELQALRDLTRRLTRMRMERGALDLDLPETDIVFGRQGEVADVRPHPRFESHRLVEECMLIANEVVAEHLRRRALPGLYRVHEEPDPIKLEQLRGQLHPFGIRFPKHILPDDLQRALDRASEIEGGGLITRMILRALAKARYCERNLGHFGLASPCYCHFTSPIRRYPDLLVHRVVREAMAPGGMKTSLRGELFERLPDMAGHTSEREERAEEIERDATTIKALEFMKPRLGEVFNGRVSGLTPFGMFVELEPWPIEGMVPLRSLDDDRYDYDPMTNTLVGRRSGRTFTLAQKVRVVVERVDPPARQMDLGLLQKETGKGSGKRNGKGFKKKGKGR
ncbi:MAG: ribonuclease R [Candidatus Sumerlaeota bacterium]|nr:ribonuclease R [Candidatus Sumerlaeota bacterium]